MNPIVIAGSGLAGLAVAREFRRLDAATPVVVVTADDGVSYSKPMLSNALATGRTAAQLASADAVQVAAQLGIELRPWTRIAAIDRGARLLRLATGTLAYGRLVLALGADPRRPVLAGDGADAVLTVNDLAGYAAFRDALAGARRVAILGAGLIGCEFATTSRRPGSASTSSTSRRTRSAGSCHRARPRPCGRRWTRRASPGISAGRPARCIDAPMAIA